MQALADKDAICEVIYTYCRAVDRRDEALLRTCFHTDATHAHGSFQGASADFIGFAFDLLKVMKETQHLVGNILIDLRGESAVTEAYWTAVHRIPATPEAGAIFGESAQSRDWVVAGRYIDRFEKRAGDWRIADRLGVHDWQRLQPASDAGFDDLPANERGHPGPADAIYAKLAAG